MYTLVTEYQLEWSAEQGFRCRYKVSTDEDWSGWLDLRPADQGLVGMLLSQQPVFYNQLTGALCAGAGYGATRAVPGSEAAAAPDAYTVRTPNSGDDEAADPAADPAAAAAVQDAEPAARALPRPWRTARTLLGLLDQVNRRYPRRSKVSDGTIGDTAHSNRVSDHNPNIIDAGVGVVTALDITHDPAHGCDAHVLTDTLVASRDPRIKYLIWNRRIVSSVVVSGQPAWTWRPYTGANPHNHHLHLSVKADKASYDSAAPWPLPPAA
jgi:hypothetical protein